MLTIVLHRGWRLDSEQARVKWRSREARRFIAFWLALWVVSLLVFFFLSVGGFLLVVAIRHSVATAVEFRPDASSRFGIRPVGLRLKNQPLWGNVLWGLSSASMFALAVFGLIEVNTSVLALLRR
jgi:hypothetical protein